jgi:hypothetical protein
MSTCINCTHPIDEEGSLCEVCMDLLGAFVSRREDVQRHLQQVDLFHPYSAVEESKRVPS